VSSVELGAAASATVFQSRSQEPAAAGQEPLPSGEDSEGPGLKLPEAGGADHPLHEGGRQEEELLDTLNFSSFQPAKTTAEEISDTGEDCGI
jgi:hypothetical protein